MTSMNAPPVREHDATLCGCISNEPCVCPCIKCCAFQKQRDKLLRMLALENRLLAKGVDPELLAELLNLKRQRWQEEEIERIVKEQLAAALEGMKLSATVAWSNLK